MRSESMTISGTLIEPGDDGSLNLREGTLRIVGDRIVAVESGLTDHPDLGGPGYLISPGFVDAHLHLPQFDSIGVAGLELLDWLETVIFPAETRWAETAFARSMAERVGGQLLRAGTTSIAAYATSHAAAAQAAIEVLGGMGFSGHVGLVLMDQNGPTGLLVGRDEAMAGCRGLKGFGRIRPSINPRFAVACSMELMQAAAQLAKETGWRLQTHLAETVAEIEAVRRIHGAAYVDVYDRAGLLGPGSLMAHGVHLSDEDLNTLRARGSVVVHCPTANRFLRAGGMDWERTRASGVAVAVGSDVAGGPDRCMVKVAKGMLENAGSSLTAGEAWWRITRGNALCLGMEDVGRLAVGSRSDILVLRPDLRLGATADPLAPIIYGWDDRWLEAAVLGGQVTTHCGDTRFGSWETAGLS